MGLDVSGVEETVASFHAYQEAWRRNLPITLRRIGENTRLLAQVFAESEGLTGVGKYSHSRDPHPGALVAKIRVRAGHHKVTITEYSRSHSARYPNYPYPRRYEYHGRAYMRPALEQERLFLPGELRLLLMRVHEEAGF